MQNKSHAVMAQRNEPADSADDFPTPPWAVRALFEYVIEAKRRLPGVCALEPAAGRGHMADVLREHFDEVRAADAYPYGYCEVRDFLAEPIESGAADWVITNPPYRLAEQFIARGLIIARIGVAMLVRTTFVESIGRYERLFRDRPPTVFAQFCERVPMVRGRLDAKASTATGYAWLVWNKRANAAVPRLAWVPPCRRILERPGDYDVRATPIWDDWRSHRQLLRRAGRQGE